MSDEERLMPLTPPAKILFYTHGLVDGGAERLWACLATAFKQRGYDVSFVQDFEASENRANLDASIPLHTLGSDHIKAVRRLSALLKEIKPDVTLSAVGGSNLKLLLANLLAGGVTQPVLSYHGEMEWKTGWLSYFSYLGLPLICKMAARTVAVSEGLAQTLATRWSADPGRLTTILNPVFYPAQAAAPSAAELAARKDVVLSVGRFVPEKDFVTLVRAFARMNRPEARLVILGKGPEQQRIEGEIRRLRLQGRVDLPGYVTEPWRTYAEAKCFVSSSSSEPFGNVVVEAMAYGLPVVATACAGPHEILQHGVHGRIVGIGNEVQLANAIAATLDEPGDPDKRRRRAQDFSFEARVPAYEALVEDVIAEARSAALARKSGMIALPPRSPEGHSP